MLPFIIDTTLRDGMQAPGVVFSRRERITIARMLDEFGIDEIEAGVPAMGPVEQGDIEAVFRLKLSCRLTVWCRAEKRDIELAEQCNAGSVHISFPVSKLLLATIGKNELWLFSACETLVSHAAKRFDFVSVGAQDALRTDPLLLRRFALRAAQCGAKRFRIADTVGIALPLEVAALVRSLKKPGMPQIEFHGHNDLGMASANAVTALESGAGAVSVTVNGQGERAGNAALEEVVMALRAQSPSSVSRYNLKNLPELCAFVSKAAKRPLCKSKPVVGEGIFDHESGIHFAGLMKNPKSYQPFLPEDIGKKGFNLRIGYHSGSSSIMNALKSMGIRIGKNKAGLLVEKVREMAKKKKRGLRKEELVKIYKESNKK
jgi:homocitrate synthase NifV